LEGLTPGKQQASTPISTKNAFGGFGGFVDAWQTAGLNANKKLLIWALVPLPAGLGVPKRRLEGLEGLTPGKRQASTPISTKKAFGGFGGFDAWQTAGFNANKKLLFGGFGGFDAWQTAGFNAKKAFGGFGAFEAWQTAGLNANIKSY